eukprot:CAMPEP_0173436494 /NCGR_PEP_ID=MMETSP1357-20121228/16257_1 /TAXON_ID=77926 /ORGANISM="Hemiselmis rufescens, Strain PCC563" /LENGTH=113 /DNA_ID=CAMNT_0014401575 /DNA_START=31 /DNA_END=370 /DNA_ORIENTATION=-
MERTLSLKYPPWNFLAAMQFLLASIGPLKVSERPLKLAWSYIVTFIPFGMSMLLMSVPSTPQLRTWHSPRSSSHVALVTVGSPPSRAAPPTACRPASASPPPPAGSTPAAAPP